MRRFPSSKFIYFSSFLVGSSASQDQWIYLAPSQCLENVLGWDLLAFISKVFHKYWAEMHWWHAWLIYSSLFLPFVQVFMAALSIDLTLNVLSRKWIAASYWRVYLLNEKSPPSAHVRTKCRAPFIMEFLFCSRILYMLRIYNYKYIFHRSIQYSFLQTNLKSQYDLLFRPAAWASRRDLQIPPHDPLARSPSSRKLRPRANSAGNPRRGSRRRDRIG